MLSLRSIARSAPSRLLSLRIVARSASSRLLNLRIIERSALRRLLSLSISALDFITGGSDKPYQRTCCCHTVQPFRHSCNQLRHCSCFAVTNRSEYVSSAEMFSAAYRVDLGKFRYRRRSPLIVPARSCELRTGSIGTIWKCAIMVLTWSAIGVRGDETAEDAETTRLWFAVEFPD